MDPYHEHGLPAQSFGKKIILKCPQHHPVIKQQPDCSQTRQDTQNKYHEGNLNIIYSYLQKHGKRILLFENTEGITLGDILFGHFHIIIAKNAPDKTLVVRCRESRHQGKKQKNEESIE